MPIIILLQRTAAAGNYTPRQKRKSLELIFSEPDGNKLQHNCIPMAFLQEVSGLLSAHPCIESIPALAAAKREQITTITEICYDMSAGTRDLITGGSPVSFKVRSAEPGEIRHKGHIWFRLA